MTTKEYNKYVLEAVTQGEVGGEPASSLYPFRLAKTTFILILSLLTGCASTNSFNSDSKYAISTNESYSQWSERQPNPQKDTYIGSGIDPAVNGVPVQWPWGRTGWGLRPFEPNF